LAFGVFTSAAAGAGVVVSTAAAAAGVATPSLGRIELLKGTIKPWLVGRALPGLKGTIKPWLVEREAAGRGDIVGVAFLGERRRDLSDGEATAAAASKTNVPTSPSVYEANGTMRPAFGASFSNCQAELKDDAVMSASSSPGGVRFFCSDSSRPRLRD
jgi:hypothetical protein